MVNLTSPSDKNFILKNISQFKKSHKTALQLQHVGYDSDKHIYVNENLTSYNYKILQNALKLKRQKCIESTFSLRGLVYVKRTKDEPPIMVDSTSKLINLFRGGPEPINMPAEYSSNNNDQN